MELFLVILVLLALIGVSNVLNRIVPAVPVPLFQVALGALLTLGPFGVHLELEPELFFVLFVAPLLFNDGRRMPRDELWKLRGSILLLAVGLVFATVLAGGYGIHAMIPSIPLSAAFALAAILSPTDAVAVSALSGRINLPKGIIRLLEGEALMNDASGLVAFKFAVAATVTGVFSLPHATVSFVLIAVGGLLSGVVLSFLVILLRTFLRRLGIEDATMHMLIQILTPFVIYMVSEEIGVSGILAVVAGGIFHAVAKDRMEPYATKLQVVSASTWSVILFILNGLVFLILGLQIPGAASVIFRDPNFDNYQVIGYIAIITVSLYALRFAWVYLFSALDPKERTNRRKLKDSVLTALSGVRGAVTLAGAFSIPLFLEDGSPFPQRDLIIFLSAGVILFTLLTASIALPLLSRRSGAAREGDKHLSENEAQIRIVEKAMRGLKEEANEENKEAVMSVLGDYNRKLQQIRTQPGFKERKAWRSDFGRLWAAGLKAEREEMERQLEAGKISPETARRFEAALGRMESLLVSGRFRFLATSLRLAFKRLWKRATGRGRKAWSLEEVKELKRLKLDTSKAAIVRLREETGGANKEAALPIIMHYQDAIERLRDSMASPQRQEKFAQMKREVELKAIQLERDALQEMYAAGEVTLGMVNSLRFFINTMEATVTEDQIE
ncbi:sodium, potassium, lithium and rubidium/H(+) antiporter [Cohnella xylanilytica]|uniref:Na+/H+ antiporter n=1 Tax=Cohnella xylanilytica TaxID=557555 RepID=A0A841TTP6_9BACL|nr:Na+/H+ antiporter [Cohnella xylanilytica]MBB6691545.1 Na+/H+ antiporter [Cohnella xylanilytica]GIO12890.1 sodium, potassium, lithium and rubidium/H(+) antiporter [Cohnella xylanilytica]